ncbi:FHA domain-containing protein [Pseudonocardia lacus]|uniref:FHA domain-containing protein n=1 Tax=Pseudonocardia lacus TaxID=2835865 RepID=UPI001BDC07ED|nr:FHA domain-containing protein [Pseudonocardia lacus]
MATCPVGHSSADDEYCDTCGLAVSAPPPPVPAPPDPERVPGRDVCAACRAPLHGRFCEECGHDNALPPPDPPDAGPPIAAPAPVWTAVVRADRAWFDEVRAREGPDVDTVEFPRYCPERRFELTGAQVAIGRRSRSRGTNPEIDLSGPPLDPGVSAQHALLVARADGGWEVVDLDSTNGTSVGDSTALLAPFAPVPLADGDRIRIGAWTTITIERARPAGTDQSR